MKVFRSAIYGCILSEGKIEVMQLEGKHFYLLEWLWLHLFKKLVGEVFLMKYWNTDNLRPIYSMLQVTHP